MSAATTGERYHALDSLRAFAMFLGVLLHVGLSFMNNPPGFWPVRDVDPTPLADVFLLAVHDFRMQLFFLLAGFFGCLLYQKYGVGGMLRHRLFRVAVPFVLALVFIVPTVQAVLLYTEIENVRSPIPVRGEVGPARPFAASLHAANPNAKSWELVADYFLSGASFAGLRPGHLWFLYYLVFFFIASALLSPLLGRLSGTRVLAVFDAGFRWVIAGRGRVMIPALFTFPLMLPMRWIVDTPIAFRPEWHILGYYFAFFGFGWVLFRHRDLVTTFGRGWKVNLAVANLVVFPVMVALILKGVAAQRDGADVADVEPMKWGGFAASVLYTWLMIVGLWGAFLHWFDRPSARVRYLADASYWCYLASLTPILMLQFWVKDWPLPGLAKFALVTAATTVLLLASYQWLVRYTFIGTILNGRRHRPRPDAKAQD